MIEVPMEDLLKKTGSIFKLVNLAAKRTKDLNEGFKPRLATSGNKKNAAIALQEISEGKIKFKIDNTHI
ncbi:MAG: DNA-directed RNA polymerase subunit omega [Candidatus Omnitrophica bacterium]|nr:DNA-directed RNA polymerase subunit omega [Candidatus Omnitrophota bacterium]MBU4477568.1 DNA-directed RNA polymerase subunit omega [Candidatus Omnitrophota bacterium]MCG2703596.1 DNA-directed RNA polymerase subunit omega [Candidatus Omnitrophota bacterium]